MIATNQISRLFIRIGCDKRPSICAVFSLQVLLSILTIGASEAAEVRFNRDVRPILTDKCFACHGPDAKTVEGGLRLDLREQAVEESGAIIPGDADASEVIARVLSDDDDLVMPPQKSHKTLTESEKQTLRDWINHGAKYERHWAYEPMRTELLSEASSLNEVIDTAISRKLDEIGLQAAEQADPVTLIRRLSFDLNGLPPSSADVQGFVEDPTAENYAKLVERYLDSPRFGERMAIYWLDLVRYADTVGYHGDQNVSQSPYRDYVISAFNANKPYDQFVREQLAGDLLPETSLEQLVASGYNRLNQTTEEGGSQAKEYLAIYFADRVRNVSQVFMGATMGCAQCHDHKYDPYTTRDFYSLGAFFADLEERGVYSARSRPPMIPVPTAKQKSELDGIDRQISELESQTETLKGTLRDAYPSWEQTEREQIDDAKTQTFLLVDDQFPGEANRSGSWDFVEPEFGVHSGSKARRQHSAGLVQHYFEGLKQPVEVTDQTSFYCWVYLDPKNPPSALMLQINDGDWSQRKVWGSDAIEYGRKPESDAAYRRAGGLPEAGQWVKLKVDAAEVELKPGSKVNGIAFTQYGGTVYWDEAGYEKDDRKSEAFRTALVIDDASRNDAQRKLLFDAYLKQSVPMIEHQKAIEGAKQSRQRLLDSVTQTVISKAGEPREIRVLPRGNWMDDSGDVVTPAIPAFLGDLQIEGRRANRLDLADWICDEENPLAARTMANRIWKLLFGRGICQSVDDLGGQGTYPSYPDLLDALSVSFVRSGWDTKQLIRSIVLSDAYQRSSTPREPQLTRDPYNEWFARQGRFPLDAEMIRDAALSVSGLLVEKVGGESVHPYQPAGYYAQLNFPRREYAADENEDQYRRGVYTHWQRTFLHPMMKAFDAPSREECTAARARSNTPLQALVLLNDPTFVEAARVFAERIMREGGSTIESKIDFAYQTAVSRSSDKAIQSALSDLYQSHLSQFQNDPEAASQVLSQGIAKVDQGLQPNELAAWTSVARVLLNLQESITRY
ncbi:PSD1 and planctomycete cytochrome C domain-containing protein [Stieleria sp. JC731]|uniref:PSD1 and planctomycete cytochrome C domain-containing protein n=1 Tax=Pirellulaceae TaxID=2691357 RepID=UPI001E2F08EA|nr:PSD1 and planctomycete cytochrome C domain-containing protein [Stieleria sp. JC731]MCC9603853.1 PSD1 and planctomycete cytochrome C domain-containing protein [Stieleria sp. JC731]